MRLNIASMKASELIEHLKSYIDIAGGDCEMLIFDKANGHSYDIINTCTDGDYVFHLPKGSIKKLIERKLSWKDEPVELK